MLVDEVVGQLAQPRPGRGAFRPVAAAAVDPALAVALGRLQVHDQVLLKRLAAERAICHRLALYLEEAVNPAGDAGIDHKWHVDCEYNLFGSDDRTDVPIDDLRKRIDVLGRRGFDVADHLVYPDVIIHRRDTTDNRLIIEAKMLRRDTRQDEIEYDLRKLSAYAKVTGGMGYEAAVFLLFSLDDETPRVDVFTSPSRTTQLTGTSIATPGSF